MSTGSVQDVGRDPRSICTAAVATHRHGIRVRDPHPRQSTPWTAVDAAVSLQCTVGCEDVEERTSHSPRYLNEGMTVVATKVSQPRV